MAAAKAAAEEEYDDEFNEEDEEDENDEEAGGSADADAEVALSVSRSISPDRTRTKAAQEWDEVEAEVDVVVAELRDGLAIVGDAALRQRWAGHRHTSGDTEADTRDGAHGAHGAADLAAEMHPSSAADGAARRVPSSSEAAGDAGDVHLQATAQLAELEMRGMQETRRHAAAAVLQAYHRGGEARAARQRWDLLTGDTSIVELKRLVREHAAQMRQIGQASRAARRLGAAGRGLLARSRTRAARLRAAQEAQAVQQAARNILRSLAVSGAPLLGSRVRGGHLPGFAHLTLLPRGSGGGGGGGARAISVQSVERAGHNRQLPRSPRTRSPLTPLRSIGPAASWAGAPQWHDAGGRPAPGSGPAPGAPPPPPPPPPPPQVGTVMRSPPLLTSGFDPAAPAAQLRSDPASLGGGATAAAAAAAAAAGIASDAATAVPSPASPASPGARRSSEEVELARRSSPPLPVTDTAALHARWLRRRMEMEEAEATARMAEAVAAAEAATTQRWSRVATSAIAERHAARRGVAWGTKVPLPSPSPHRAESFDWASLEWLEAPAPLVRRLPQLYGATGQKYGVSGQKYGATGQTLRGSASAPKLQQQPARASWRTPDGRSRQSRGRSVT